MFKQIYLTVFVRYLKSAHELSSQNCCFVCSALSSGVWCTVGAKYVANAMPMIGFIKKNNNQKKNGNVCIVLVSPVSYSFTGRRFTQLNTLFFSAMQLHLAPASLSASD